MANSRICSVDGCTKPAHRRGWCGGHYERWKRYGEPTAGRTLNGEQWQYLLDHMHDDCPKWPYRRSIVISTFNGQGGRGRVYDPRVGKQRSVHVIVCELVHGPAPTPKHQAAHSCGLGHEGCFGASCLSWKTASENQMDRVLHGTSNRGQRHGSNKLSPEDVLAIRRNLDALGWRPLSERYGVTRETIRDIARRKIWAWLP